MGQAGRGVALGLAVLLLAGCHAARRLFAPLPSLRAASVAPFAVDVEFDVGLDRASAEDLSRYQLYPAGNRGAAVAIYSATIVDTVFSRTVQLLVPAWVAAAPDSADFEVATTGVRDARGASTGNRVAAFRTGLSWRLPMRDLFDAHCNFCHGATRQDGSYRTDSYAALLGGGTNATPNLIPGDPRCLIVTKCKPGNSMFEAGQLSYLDFDILINWITNYGARP